MLKYAFSQIDSVDYIFYDPQQISAFLLLQEIIKVRGFIPPEYFVTGAVSYDKVQDGNNNFAIFTDMFRGSGSAIETITNVKLSLSLGQYKIGNRLVTPRNLETVMYTYSVARERYGGRLSARVFSETGLSASVSRTYSENLSDAYQSLVEIGVTELVGKLFQAPYWQCLQIESTSLEFQERVRSWYHKTSPKKRMRFAQQALKQAGYYEGTIDGVQGKKTRRALTRFQLNYDLIPDGRLNVNFFLTPLGGVVTGASDSATEAGTTGTSSSAARLAQQRAR